MFFTVYIIARDTAVSSDYRTLQKYNFENEKEYLREFVAEAY